MPRPRGPNVSDPAGALGGELDVEPPALLDLSLSGTWAVFDLQLPDAELEESISAEVERLAGVLEPLEGLRALRAAVSEAPVGAERFGVFVTGGRCRALTVTQWRYRAPAYVLSADGETVSILEYVYAEQTGQLPDPGQLGQIDERDALWAGFESDDGDPIRSLDIWLLTPSQTEAIRTSFVSAVPGIGIDELDEIAVSAIATATWL